MPLFLVSKNCNKAFLDVLKSRGEVLLLGENPCLNEAESCHGDMQVFKTGDKSCIVSSSVSHKVINALESRGISVMVGEGKLSQNYPENVKFNVLRAGKHLFHNIKHTEKKIVEYAEQNGLGFIDVKQGYCACSSCYVEFCNLIITGDKGIIKAAKANNYNVCVFDHNTEIILDGYGHGFIGGCIASVNNGKTLIFNGDIKGRYPEFAEKPENLGIEIIGIEGEPLTDIGGAVCFNEEL